MMENPISILLVEDNPGDVQLFRRVMKEVEPPGVTLTCCEYIADALKMSREKHIDVILLDLSLPDGRGLESFLAVQSGIPDVPIVVLTGLVDENLAVQAVRQGAQDYLVKGQVDQHLLLRAIRYAIERKRAGEKLLIYQKRLRSLASQITQTEEKERRRIATDLHDHIGQPLALAKIKMGFLPEMTRNGNVQEVVNEIRMLLDQAIQYTRSLTFDLSSPILYEMGFESAVEALVDQFQRQHHFQTEFRNDNSVKPLEENVQTVLFRAVQELLVNIVKHARAENVDVSIWKDNEDICITVADDGVGFDPATVHPGPDKNGGFGLFNIQERLDFLDGEFRIHSLPGQGTQITLRAPLMKNLNNKK